MFSQVLFQRQRSELSKLQKFQRITADILESVCQDNDEGAERMINGLTSNHLRGQFKNIIQMIRQLKHQLADSKFFNNECVYLALQKADRSKEKEMIARNLQAQLSAQIQELKSKNQQLKKKYQRLNKQMIKDKKKDIKLKHKNKQPQKEASKELSGQQDNIGSGSLIIPQLPNQFLPPSQVQQVKQQIDQDRSKANEDMPISGRQQQLNPNSSTITISIKGSDPAEHISYCRRAVQTVIRAPEARSEIQAYLEGQGYEREHQSSPV